MISSKTAGMIMRQLLIEGLKGAFPFIADKTKIVQEAVPGSSIVKTRIPGRFSVCDSVNGNNRRYSKKVWEKNLQANSPLMESIKRSRAFGTLEHPKDGTVDLLSPISHIVSEAKLSDNGEVIGEITIVNTDEGKKINALIEAGYNPMVSSRGYGSLTKANDGVDEVQDDFVCEGWDIVMKPSFENAELVPDRGTKVESKPVPVKETSLAENAVPKAVTPPVPTPVSESSSKSTPEPIMNINEIKSKITSFKTLEANKLDPQRFAESVSQLADLHQSVADYVAEDTKRSYDGQKLHREIETIEAAWSEAQSAPAKSVVKLKENQGKLLKVVKAVVETGLKFKSTLAEAIKEKDGLKKLVEELTTNGRGWKALAEKRKEKLQHTEAKYQVACEALDVLRDRYNEDLTLVGGRNLVLEFKDKITPEVKAQIKEAKKPKEIVAIREQLEGKTPSTEQKPAESGKPAPVVEGKTAPKAAPATPPAPVTPPAPASEGKKPVINPTANPLRSMNESVAMIQRLSQSAK